MIEALVCVVAKCRAAHVGGLQPAMHESSRGGPIKSRYGLKHSSTRKSYELEHAPLSLRLMSTPTTHLSVVYATTCTFQCQNGQTKPCAHRRRASP